MAEDTSVLVLLFVISALLVGALLKSCSRFIPVPYSVALLIIGLGAGLAGRDSAMSSIEQAVHNLASIEPHLILLLFLPTLIFESAFSLEPHLFKRMFSQIAILAVPGMLLSTLLTGALAYYLFPWQWSWTICLLFGALISATDPVAVVALLKEVSSRKRLEILIEGESLLNDGTAIVLFALFYGLLSQGGGSFSIIEFSGSFIYVVVLGFFIGIVIGALVLLWIAKLFNQLTTEITLTIAAAYLAYYIAENVLHASGVVAVVSLGVMLAALGRTKISPEVADFLHHFWQMMAHVANTLIFILVGLIIAVRIRLDVVDWWFNLLLLYIGIQLIRALCVIILMPLLSRFGIGINRDKAVVLIWGGLRGAVSLALALIIAQDSLLPKELGDQVLFLTAGIVVMTIVINSSSMRWVLAKLKLDQLPAAQQLTVEKVKYSVKQELLLAIPTLKKNEFLQRANWEKLIGDYEKIPPPKTEQTLDSSIAFRRRILEAERKFYWSQFANGEQTGTATEHLVDAVEKALDGEPKLAPRDSLLRLWRTPWIVLFCSRYPLLNRVALHFAFERLALSYDTARSFVQAQEEIIPYVASLAPSDADKEAVLAEIEQNKKATRRRIEELRDCFPDISYSLETHTAHRLMLNLERAHIETLVNEGVLANNEAEKLVTELERQLAGLRKQPNMVSAKLISEILSTLAWAEGLKPSTLDQLGKIAIRQIFNSGELLYKQHTKAQLIGVIIRGQVERQSVEHEIVVSRADIIGTYGLLSGRYNDSAKAVTPVELLWFDITKLRHIIARDLALAQVIEQQLHQELTP
ncbi:sodium:proton antiporter [Motilimonas cestriensis]|uniref:Sodium:proton antiporter n=1 Tax=Motilimonas cestriensis TaxID=2742685 RepID=A0ABS8W7H7_9GAMM|nr:sodium:proton antiporter [Motilimonas cestriensis]MCE2594225.1 sodium:proton antiporter [Motilimonas cestriensis]